MQAVVINQYGGPEELQMTTIDQPTIAADEVLVAVKATSINPIDWKARQGLLKGMFDWQMPVVLGWDVAGIIVAAGPAVTKFKLGDAVFARPDIYEDGRRGTYAEYAAVKEDKLALKPTELSFEQAAALPLAGLTAYQVIHNQLKIQAGEKVLIQAGAGGVGLNAIQIAKYLGAKVATTASPNHHDLLKKLGADQVIDYHTTAIQDVLHDYDAVFDTIDAIDDGLAILKPTGRLVTIDGQPTDAQKAQGPTVTSWWLQPNGQELAILGELAVQGQLQIVIDQVFPFSTAGLQAAHRYSENSHSAGKLIINVGTEA
ncbi:NADP-dependent oxidoreductase [Lactiplantibacillus paraplantarum]|uniref:NADP-dependent oxidoreductase n=1 Tax=Lactiplantibacillus paraplantarum TaxID=60520 RepID=A0AAD0X7U6_9LACO|nr:NADP-dependent oxidoreductase [Lactiplantibacillus paraplantarum]AVW10522.1 NADP-dependent oxidoreductase [Lactiplantibacillus paraplantarum]AYJ38765.1 NADP-dependent oxidoreductase [Lactiplantibacillus paraplantarum]ERL44792.1 oxidoreductase [Lactiplantibacillus paraplantarum]KRL51467.1 oxidoreductase [Lactiplantibacillus paraplantarum DSM 10667]MCU4683855.1 NADP-dependent oxidoreductase [Lactiplantibacillus paraplantarum]